MGKGYKNVTNNQMELGAIKVAMETLAQKNVEGYEIEFKIDSMYCINGIEK
jgi:ribonuclease HI